MSDVVDFVDNLERDLQDEPGVFQRMCKMARSGKMGFDPESASSYGLRPGIL